MYTKSFVVLFIGIFCLTNAQKFLETSCPAVKIMPNLNTEKFAGVWYEYARIPYHLTMNLKCNVAKFTFFEHGEVKLNNAMINATTGITMNSETKASYRENGKIKIDFLTENGANENIVYTVLDTDYTKYVTVYANKEVENNCIVFAFILTRERQPEQSTISQAESSLQKNNITPKDLAKTDQNGCENVKV